MLTQYDEFKCRTCTRKNIATQEDYPGKELEGQSLEVVEKSYYIGSIIGGGAVDNISTRLSNGWSNFRDFLILITSRGLPVGVK